MKLAKLLSLVLVFIMLFSLLAISASAILCEDQENVNEQGVVYAEKNGPTKSVRGYMAVGGEIRPEDDEEFDGSRPDDPRFIQYPTVAETINNYYG